MPVPRPGTAGPPRLPRPAPAERAASARLGALDAAARDGRAAAEEASAAEVAERVAPLIEPIPGDAAHRAVTFLWRGTAATRRVLALVNRLADPLDLSGSLMRNVPATDVWGITYRLGLDHSGSYRLAEGTGPAGTDLRGLAARAVHDPLNPRTVPIRWDDGRASVFALPGAPAPPWRPWDSPSTTGTAPEGTVRRERVRSAALGGERDVWVYVPPGRRSGDGPLDTLVLLDGDMWFAKCGVRELFDRLIADGTVPPLAVLAPHAVSNATRMAEFGGDPAHTEFLTSELMAWASERLPLSADPARTAIAGESLGGLTALHVGLEAPERFGKVLAQSSSLWWNPDGDPAADPWLTGRYARSDRRALRIHLRVGRHEWAMVDQHRDLHRTLRAKGYPVAYTEYNGGHDYVCWAAGLAAGLTDLLGTPPFPTTVATPEENE
ncbi:esterase family protein [Actinomadura yumaensis]|uniref:Esterase family protein n=1 Tax=Actinomadura yumaensis TaxID=111807 RepID=A0ABW2CW75_9ACTN